VKGGPGSPRVLHVFGSLAANDPQAARAVRVANGLGAGWRHSFVAGDGDRGALDAIARGVSCESVASFPTLHGLPTPGRLQAIARAMLDYHLVLSYGRVGARAALAHTAFSQVHALPPLIHHEDGSDETDRQRKSMRSRWLRRVALGKASGLVVPSETMEAVALIEWQQPMGRVKTIPDGIDAEAASAKVPRNALPRLQKRAGERWMVCWTGPDSGASVAAIVRALDRLDPRWHLVAVADGPERARLLAEAATSDVENRVHPVEPATARAVLLGLADMIVIPEGREPVPFAALEAMASGLPLAGFATEDLAAQIGDDNAGYLARPGDVAALEAGIERLAGDDFLRKTIGAANREQIGADRRSNAMLASYRRLYASAMGREGV